MEFAGERYIACQETTGQPIGREHWQWYLMAAQLLNTEDTVLDIAYGAGYGSEYLGRTAKFV